MFLQSLNVFKEESFSITSDHLPIKPNFDLRIERHSLLNYPHVMKPHLKLLWNTETKLNVVYWIKLPQTDLYTEKNIDYQWSF